MSKKNRNFPTQSNSTNNQQNRLYLEARKEFFAGPLPHPDILKKYNEVFPSAAERIVAQAEAQTAHRIKIEEKVVQSEIVKSYLGLIFAFVIGVIGVGGGIYLAALGNLAFGGIMSGASIVTLAGSFIYGTKSRKDERMQKRNKI